MRLLAIDPASSKCGIAIYENEKLILLDTLLGNALTPLGRRLGIASFLASHIKTADRVISEEPFLQGKANTGMQRLLGMIEIMSGQTISFIHPMSVKRLIAPGSREKIDLALAVGRLLGTPSEQKLIADAIYREAFDETDAAAIGLTYYMKEKDKNAF